MTFERIKFLIDLLPDDSDYFREILNFTPQINAINKFICAYKDISFGYKFIKAFAKSDKEFPVMVDEPVLTKAYNFEKYGIEDEDTIFAISITHPSNKTLKDAIEAFLITDEPLDKLSEVTGFPVSVLNTYEQLFFNVRDRKKESAWIATLVYPDSRMVEVKDNYIKNEDHGKLLLRSAYNNGLEDAAYFVGHKIDSLLTSGASSAEMSNKLESVLLTNGYFLARNGFINQRGTGSTGIAHARSILIAAKQGGQDANNTDTDGLGGLGEEGLMAALMEIKGPEMEEKTENLAKIEITKLTPKEPITK